jgi:hypothetical protein
MPLKQYSIEPREEASPLIVEQTKSEVREENNSKRRLKDNETNKRFALAKFMP